MNVTDGSSVTSYLGSPAIHTDSRCAGSYCSNLVFKLSLAGIMYHKHMENAVPVQEYTEDTFPNITDFRITTDPQEQMYLNCGLTYCTSFMATSLRNRGTQKFF